MYVNSINNVKMNNMKTINGGSGGGQRRDGAGRRWSTLNGSRLWGRTGGRSHLQSWWLRQEAGVVNVQMGGTNDLLSCSLGVRWFRRWTTLHGDAAGQDAPNGVPVGGGHGGGRGSRSSPFLQKVESPLGFCWPEK